MALVLDTPLLLQLNNHDQKKLKEERCCIDLWLQREEPIKTRKACTGVRNKKQTDNILIHTQEPEQKVG